MLNTFVSLSPLTTRPKCLFIYYSNNDELGYNAKEILHYAWSLQFLDFTIMKINSINQILLIYYNPFEGAYNIQYLKKITNLFPDKFKNVDKYPFKLPGFTAKPFMIMQRNDKGSFDLSGSCFLYFKTFAEKFNFQLQFKILEDKINRLSFPNMLLMLEKNSVRAVPMNFLVSTFLYNKSYLIGLSLGDSKVVFIIPSIDMPRVTFPYRVLVYVFFFPIIILLFFVIVHVLKFQLKLWNMIYIHGVLLNITMRQPQTAIEKIIFLIMIIIAMNYSSDIFSKLTDIKVTVVQQDYNTFEDFTRSKMTIYTTINSNNYDNASIQNLLSSANKSKDVIDCLQTLIATRNIICIIPYISALYAVKQNLNDKGMPIMKLAKPTFRHDFMAMPYEKASPFAEKIDEMIQQIHESGITNYWNFNISHRKTFRSTEDVDMGTTNTLFVQLIVIIAVGCSLATLSFLCELIINTTNRSHKTAWRKSVKIKSNEKFI